MRSLLLAAALTLVAAPAFAADPVEGEWLIQDKSGKVRIAPCPGRPDRMCGTTSLVKDPTKVLDAKNPDPALRTRPLLGQQTLREF